MTINQIQLNRFLKYLPYGLFFLAAFIYYSFFASHIFYFQEKSSLFVFSSDYLKENMQQPGGLLVYISSFLTSFGHYPFAGSFIITAVLLFVIILSSGIIRKISGKSAGPFPWLIALILFYLQCNYQYLFVNNLGILFQLAFFRLALNRPKGWLPVVFIPVWYYFTGGFALIYVIMYVLWQIFERPERFLYRMVTLLILSFVSFYIFAEFLFFQETKNLLTFPWSPEGTGMQTNIFTGAVCAICILPVLAVIRKRNALSDRLSGQRYALFGSALLVVIMLSVTIFKYDKKTLNYFRVEKMFVENRFQELIDFNLKNLSSNTLTSYLNNIALCETGRLNDLLFHFPQSTDGSTLFLKWEIVSEILRRGGYFYYCTGMINEAHRWAFEYMVMKGLTPEGLKMMIKTELINGNYKTAGRYNNILRRTFFYRKDAKEFDKLLYNDAAINSHPEYGQKRRIKVKRDFFSITDDPFINVERVIATDSLNRQAFEYKLAWLLINKDYQGIANEWKNLGRYNFKSIPVHIEEAGVAIKSLYNINLPAAGNLRISNVTENRFVTFLQIFQSYGSNLQSAEPALKKQFGDTFWYYVFYK
jgi:hypothetical protein